MSPSNAECWEQRCERCGRCCYEKIDSNGTIYYTPVPCEHLDPQSRLCTVYDQRHDVRPGCTPVTAEVISAGILPGDCPYVRSIDDYRPPILCVLPKAPTKTESDNDPTENS